MSKVNRREMAKRLVKSSPKPYSSNRTLKVNLHKSDVGKMCQSKNCGEANGSKNLNDSQKLIHVINFLNQHSFKYETVPDSESKQTSFFMQDTYMDNFFSYYPEYVCFDILCEIPELDKSLVLFIGLDTNGHSEIVSVGLIQSENQQEISWLCEAFKKHNPDWKRIEFILSDQCCDRDILLKVFPDKLIFISFFHCMKAFRKDMSSLDPGIVNQDLNKAFQLFEQMMFVTSESAYMDLLKQMKQMHPQIFSLFKKNWHLKKELWALGLCSDMKIVLKAFNSYLLNIRRKIKPVVSTQHTLENVLKNLHSAIIKLRKDWFQKFTCIFPSPLALCTKKQAMQKYFKYFTPFAVELVNEQLNNSENMRSIQKNEHCTYKVNEAIVSLTTCSCSFHTLMMLPCCHIFAVRKFLSLPLNVEMGRSNWVSKNYQNSYLALYGTYATDGNFGLSAFNSKERYMDLIQTSKELWDLILNCPENVSQERLEIYQDLLKTWKSNFKVEIKVSEKPVDLSNCNSESFENKSTDYFKEMYGISLDDILDSENDFSSVSLCSADENDLF